MLPHDGPGRTGRGIEQADVERRLPGRASLARSRKAHTPGRRNQGHDAPCDAADPASVDRLFAHIDQQFPKPLASSRANDVDMPEPAPTMRAVFDMKSS
jgi:hypothetical protein